MRIIHLILSLFYLTSINAEELLTIEVLTQKIQKENLIILQNAEKVYQAKLSIDSARLGLLPKLNIWTIGKIAIDPSAILDVAQEIAPFLVPANWFRLKETEILFKAELEGYHALKGNEVFQARSLFYRVLLDQELMNNIEYAEKKLKLIADIADDQFDLGLLDGETARNLKIQHLNILQDLSKIKNLVKYEKSILKEITGIAQNNEISLKSVFIPNIGDEAQIDPVGIIETVLKVSPELKQQDYFKEAIPLLKKEVAFSFLGVPSISRGTAGGIFDDIPESSGLGFSTGKQISLVSSKEKMIELQRKGIEETLKRQVYNLTQDYNSSIEMFRNVSERKKLSQMTYDFLEEKVSLGEIVSLTDLSEGSIQLLQANTLFLEENYNFLTSKDRLNRMLLEDAYKDLNQNAPVDSSKEKECKKTIFGKVKCK